MNWYSPPKVHPEKEDGIAICRLGGDWTRDLPLDVRHAATDSLRTAPSMPQIVDLSDIAFLDSWGEETIVDILAQVRESRGQVAWIFDNSRSASYEGLRRALQRRHLEAREFPNRQAAISFVTSDP